MIPLRDTISSRRFPVVTLALIVVNSLVFIYEVLLIPRGINAFISVYGFIPARLFQPFGLFEKIIPVFSSMFLQSDVFHLAGTMLYLWIFGHNVEDKLGRFRFLFFYLLTGGIAGFAHVLTGPQSAIPAIGASGAVSGILGAYLVLFPGADIRCSIPLFWRRLKINALFFLGVWFLGQLFWGFSSGGLGASTGIAFWAHIGGFTAGMLLVRFFRLPVSVESHAEHPVQDPSLTEKASRYEYVPEQKTTRRRKDFSWLISAGLFAFFVLALYVSFSRYRSPARQISPAGKNHPAAVEPPGFSGRSRGAQSGQPAVESAGRRVEGISYTRINPAVMIGGRIYYEGDSVGDGTVTSITRGDVVITYGKEKKAYRVGTYIP